MEQRDYVLAQVLAASLDELERFGASTGDVLRYRRELERELAWWTRAPFVWRRYHGKRAQLEWCDRELARRREIQELAIRLMPASRFRSLS